jgi:hypothetical protein
MRRQLLRAGAVTCLAAIGLVWWPSPATAEGEAEVGWWYRLSGGVPEGSPESQSVSAASTKQAPPPTLPPTPVPPPVVPLPEDPPAAPTAVPPPASVPEGGLYVANDTFGALAIGAVRFHVGQVGETRLTLAFAEGGASGGAIPIVACPLLEGFEAVANGSWRDRPAHDCARAQSLGTLGTDGSMSFVLSAAFQQGAQETLDIVLLPDPANGTPFSVTFDTVSPDALAVTGAAPERPLPPQQTPSFVPDPAAPAASFNPSTGAAPRSPSPGTSTAAGGAPPATPAAGAPGVTPEAPSSPAQAVSDVFDDRPWARWVATGILGAIALGMAAASVRTPAASAEKGVGRFARQREGLPPALT